MIESIEYKETMCFGIMLNLTSIRSGNKKKL